MRSNWIGIADDLTADDVLGESYANSPSQHRGKGWTVTRKVDPAYLDLDPTPRWKRRSQRIFGGIVLLVILAGYFSADRLGSQSTSPPNAAMPENLRSAPQGEPPANTTQPTAVPKGQGEVAKPKENEAGTQGSTAIRQAPAQKPGKDAAQGAAGREAATKKSVF